jgi:hypothetical protein
MLLGIFIYPTFSQNNVLMLELLFYKVLYPKNTDIIQKKVHIFMFKKKIILLLYSIYQI